MAETTPIPKREEHVYSVELSEAAAELFCRPTRTLVRGEKSAYVFVPLKGRRIRDGNTVGTYRGCAICR
jgi:hypothetical protein